MRLNSIIKKQDRGFTLIELTVVIAVLLGLISILVIGIQAYLEGQRRASCILNINNSQKALRSYTNLNELSVGDSVTGLGTMDASNPLITSGLLVVAPTCPSKGTYTTTGDTIPDYSDNTTTNPAYIQCDYNDNGSIHVPKDTTGW